MTDPREWTQAEHPREATSGRFTEKTQSAPELTLIDVPEHLRVQRPAPAPARQPVIIDVPEHLRAQRPAPTLPPVAPLIIDVPAHLVAQRTTPWHLRPADQLTPTSEQDNPLLAAFRSAQAQHGDTAEQWRSAIDAHFNGEDSVQDIEIFEAVHEVIGTPRDEGDVDHWMARTQAWHTHALVTLTPEPATAEEPEAEELDEYGNLVDACWQCGDFDCDCESVASIMSGRA